ncbi:MAG: glycerol-3-phosphate 1-O-acyltransferase PlsY [Clostridiales bacterium]|jgi:glycerol-3-phosphate acyltransferase PlsY|nr:glycerol-3-phosphate 1-O-acyltransferase PlsY [Clostridiales bacterium]
MLIFKLLLSLVAGYILGSVNTAVIAGNVYGVNLRKRGSGSGGLTNALRELGPKAAVIVLLGDVAKGVLACLVGYALTAGEVGSERFVDIENPNLGMLLAGTSCIFGHIFPLFFQFKGGKGVLTSATVIFLMDYRIGAIALCVFIIMLLLTRYVSVGSIIAAVSLPIVSLILAKPNYFMVYSVTIALLLIIMHRKNIGRLISGTEPKLKVKS